MNILILNWRDPKNPKAGGAEYVTLEHAKAWVKKGHKVFWFTSSFKNSKETEIIEGVDIFRKGGTYSMYLLAPFFYLFSGNKFDLVIDQFHGAPFFSPLYVRKPKILFIHEIPGKIWDLMFPFPINIIGKLAENFYFLLYKNIPIWTDAPSTINDLVKYGIKKENCTAILCPISKSALNKLPVKEKNPTFIFVSRLVPMKGIEAVINAFKIIKEKEKNAKLWILGTGENKYFELLNKKVLELNLESSVKFWGKVSENKKYELLKKAHLLLHASVNEGWGLVVIEAASQATPSVVYNVNGLRDSVKNGITGIVLNNNNPEELAKGSLKLIHNKKQYKIFQKNSLNWAKSLNWVKATKESLNLIKEALKS